MLIDELDPLDPPSYDHDRDVYDFVCLCDDGDCDDFEDDYDDYTIDSGLNMESPWGKKAVLDFVGVHDDLWDVIDASTLPFYDIDLPEIGAVFLDEPVEIYDYVGLEDEVRQGISGGGIPYSGLSGYSGFSGYSGYSGVVGHVGYSGYSGHMRLGLRGTKYDLEGVWDEPDEFAQRLWEASGFNPQAFKDAFWVHYDLVVRPWWEARRKKQEECPVKSIIDLHVERPLIDFELHADWPPVVYDFERLWFEEKVFDPAQGPFTVPYLTICVQDWRLENFICLEGYPRPAVFDIVARMDEKKCVISYVNPELDPIFFIYPRAAETYDFVDIHGDYLDPLTGEMLVIPRWEKMVALNQRLRAYYKAPYVRSIKPQPYDFVGLKNETFPFPPQHIIDELNETFFREPELYDFSSIGPIKMPTVPLVEKHVSFWGIQDLRQFYDFRRLADEGLPKQLLWPKEVNQLNIYFAYKCGADTPNWREVKTTYDFSGLMDEAGRIMFKQPYAVQSIPYKDIVFRRYSDLHPVTYDFELLSDDELFEVLSDPNGLQKVAAALAMNPLLKNRIDYNAIGRILRTEVYDFMGIRPDLLVVSHAIPPNKIFVVRGPSKFCVLPPRKPVEVKVFDNAPTKLRYDILAWEIVGKAVFNMGRDPNAGRYNFISLRENDPEPSNWQRSVSKFVSVFDRHKNKGIYDFYGYEKDEPDWRGRNFPLYPVNV